MFMSRFFQTTSAPKYIASHVLYERKPVTQLWSRFTAVAKQNWKWRNLANKDDPKWYGSKPPILQVYGPPGSGKSSATFYWVWCLCQRYDENAYWVSCATEQGKCWFLEKKGNGADAQVNAHSVPLATKDVSDASVVVFDGILQGSLEQWRGIINDLVREGIVVFVVSSERLRFHQGDSGDIIVLSNFSPSWTLEEYIAACANDPFWTSVHKYFANGSIDNDANEQKKTIESKFYLAGHSARFMFNKTDYQVTQKLEEAAGEVDVDTLEKAVNSWRSSGDVITILARLDDTKNGPTPNNAATFPTQTDLQSVGTTRADFGIQNEEMDFNNAQARLVSDFATFQVTRKLSTNVQRVRNLALQLSNRVIEGYAFEQQLEKSLREAMNPGLFLRLSDEKFKNSQYRVGSFIKCQKNELWEILSQELEDDTWIFVCGQQGAFDAVHVVSSTHIRFVQATVGVRHSFSLDIIDTLSHSLALAARRTWSHIEFMLVRPETERFKQFTLNLARGKVQNYQRFDNQPWDTTDYRNNVVVRFLDWY